MSWDKTYSHTVALGFDRLGAALIFNEPDITISSLCWIVRMANTKCDQVPYVEGACAPCSAISALWALKLSPWQLWLLWRIGDGLEHFWPGHCAAARQGDLDTSARSRVLLGA